MSRIFVDFSRLEELERECKDIASRINDIKSDFKSTVSKLDWDVKCQNDINSTGKRIASKIESYSDSLKGYSKYLNSVNSEYRKLDEYKFDEAKTDIGKLTKTGIKYKDASTVIKSILEMVEQTTFLPGKALKKLVSTGESLFKLLKTIGKEDFKSLAGADAVADVVSDVSSVADALLEYYKDKSSPIVGVVSEISEGISEVCGSIDTIVKSVNSCDGANVFTILKESVSIVDSISDAIFDTIDAVTNSAGGKIWHAFADLITGCFDGLVVGIENGLKDGKWDMMDTAKVMFDVSYGGLHDAIGSLFDSFTGGIVSEDLFDMATCSLNSDSIVNAIVGQGTDYIQDAGLSDAYDSTGSIGKISMTCLGYTGV